MFSPFLVGEIMAEGMSLGTELCCIGEMVAWAGMKLFSTENVNVPGICLLKCGVDPS